MTDLRLEGAALARFAAGVVTIAVLPAGVTAQIATERIRKLERP
jgi:hypothetical protein